MRKFFISLAVATATLTAVPAAAQPRDHDSRWDHRDDRRDDRRDGRYDRGAVHRLLGELARVDQRIERSARRGIISPREALSLRRESNQIRAHLNRSARNGLSGREVQQLRIQIERLEQRVRIERRDRDGRRY